MKKTLFLCAASLCSISLFSWGLACYLDPNISFESESYLQLLNTAPVFLFVLLAWGLSNKLLFCFVLSILVGKALFAINAIKLEHLNLPMMYTDFRLIKCVISSPKLYYSYADPSLSALMIPGALLLATIILLLFEKPLVRKNSIIRFLVILIAGGGFYFLLSPSSVNAAYKEYMTEWSMFWPYKNAAKYGVFAMMVRDSGIAGTKFYPPPEKRDIVAWSKKLEEQLDRSIPPEEELPDIVVVLSESFIDPGIVNGISLCSEIENFCSLAKGGESGYLTVPTYGGLTLRTEFEFLTGVDIHDNLHPSQRDAYFTVVTWEIPSIASVLKSVGYETTVIHPNDKGFWNRASALTLLGFDRLLFKESFAGAKELGLWTADFEVMDRILEVLRDDIPQFVFAITMENHGPQGKQMNLPKEEVEVISVPEKLPPQYHRTWRENVFHLHQADKELSRLVERLSKRKRRTILLFFGDHLPAMPELTKEIGFSNERKPVYLLLDVHNPLEEPRKVNSDSAYLASQVLETAGLRADPFFPTLNSLLDAQRAAKSKKEKKELKDLIKTLQRLKLEGEITNSEILAN